MDTHGYNNKLSGVHLTSIKTKDKILKQKHVIVIVKHSIINRIMDNSAAKVGQIFTEAGAAFNKLAEMTMLLHPLAESSPSVCAQTKTPVKRKAPEERLSVPANITSGQVNQVIHLIKAQDSEDSKGLNKDIKVECESSTEEVVT